MCIVYLVFALRVLGQARLVMESVNLQEGCWIGEGGHHRQDCNARLHDGRLEGRDVRVKSHSQKWGFELEKWDACWSFHLDFEKDQFLGVHQSLHPGDGPPILEADQQGQGHFDSFVWKEDYVVVDP